MTQKNKTFLEIILERRGKLNPHQSTFHGTFYGQPYYGYRTYSQVKDVVEYVIYPHYADVKIGRVDWEIPLERIEDILETPYKELEPKLSEVFKKTELENWEVEEVFPIVIEEIFLAAAFFAKANLTGFDLFLSRPSFTEQGIDDALKAVYLKD